MNLQKVQKKWKKVLSIDCGMSFKAMMLSLII